MSLRLFATTAQTPEISTLWFEGIISKHTLEGGQPKPIETFVFRNKHKAEEMAKNEMLFSPSQRLLEGRPVCSSEILSFLQLLDCQSQWL